MIALLLSALLQSGAATLGAADTSAAFQAAGFRQTAGEWRGCGDPGTDSYQPGTIEQVGDLNGDGRPEAIIAEGSTFCFGNTGAGFTIVGKQPDGNWSKLYQSEGIAAVLPSKVRGWFEVQVGLPGTCFPILQWNGSAYAMGRHADEAGKACSR